MLGGDRANRHYYCHGHRWPFVPAALSKTTSGTFNGTTRQRSLMAVLHAGEQHRAMISAPQKTAAPTAAPEDDDYVPFPENDNEAFVPFVPEAPAESSPGTLLAARRMSARANVEALFEEAMEQGEKASVATRQLNQLRRDGSSGLAQLRAKQTVAVNAAIAATQAADQAVAIQANIQPVETEPVTLDVKAIALAAQAAAAATEAIAAAATSALANEVHGTRPLAGDRGDRIEASEALSTKVDAYNAALRAAIEARGAYVTANATYGDNTVGGGTAAGGLARSGSSIVNTLFAHARIARLAVATHAASA